MVKGLVGVLGDNRVQLSTKEKILSAKCPKDAVLYPLWYFTVENQGVLVRARTQREAFVIAQTNCWRTGVIITSENWVPCEAANLYNKSHVSGWLHNKPGLYDYMPYRVSK